jgi:hypothetical protein
VLLVQAQSSSFSVAPGFLGTMAPFSHPPQGYFFETLKMQQAKTEKNEEILA